MKRHLALLLTLCLVFSLAACSGGAAATPTPTAAPTATPEPSAQPAKLKLGLGVSTALSGTDASADGNGNAQVDSTVAAVLLDENGVIVDVIIDVAQNKMAFTTEGEVLDKEKEFKTKRELGDDYGMKARSGIGKEWYEQAQGLCDYIIGKTLAEVTSIAVDDTTAPTGEDLRATTTIKIGGYVKAITLACENAQELGTVEGDKLGLGVFTTASGSTDASADGEGIAYAYTTYAALTTDADGKVTAAIEDATQSKINISTEGAITTDMAAAKVLTKNQLKDDYGMKARSGIGKEWYEQAAGFCAYLVGKNAAEIEGIAVDDTTAPTDEALRATTTIKLGDMIEVAVKAVKDAAAR